MTNRLLTGGDCPQGILDVVEGTIGCLALTCGFSAIEYAALRALSNLYFAFVEDVGVSAQGLAESSSRTSILLSDLVVSLADMGFNLSLLNDLTNSRQVKRFREPLSISSAGGAVSNGVITTTGVIGPSGATIIPSPLKLHLDWRGCTGSGFPTGILPTEHCPAYLQLPGLPEQHTFLHSSVRRPPISSDPAALRRRLVDQRRRLQQSLIRFLARIHPVHYLFPGDSELFTLVTARKDSRAYLSALLSDSAQVGDDSGCHKQSGSTQLTGGNAIGLTDSSDDRLTKSNLSGVKSGVATDDNVGKGGEGLKPVSNIYLIRPKFPEY